MLAQAKFGHLGKDVGPQAQRGEEAGQGEQHLCPAEKEETGLGEGKVKTGHDPGLGFSVEIHQGVAAYQEVQAGDGGILDEIVAPEDDRAARLGTENVAIPCQLKILVAQFVGKRMEVFARVTGLAGLVQGLLVYIRGVDLDPLVELLRSQGLGQQNSQSVGFLARSTADTPDPDGLVCGLARNDLGKDLVGQVSPSQGIAEESGDVDQNGVKEAGGLFGVSLQVVLVRAQ